MKFLYNLLFFFGVNTEVKDGNNKRTFKCKKALLILLRIFWDIEVILIIVNAAFYSKMLNHQKHFLVHILDALFIAILRFVFHKKIKRIITSLEKIESIDICMNLHDNQYLRLNIVLFLSFQLFLNLISLIRTFISNNLVELYENIFLFNSLEINNMPMFIRMILRFNIVCYVSFYNIFPSIIKVICILGLMAIRKLVRKFIKNLQMNLCRKEYSLQLKYLVGNLMKYTSILKELNQELSLIIFLLIGFWTTYVMYDLTKLMSKPVNEGIFSAVISVLEIINYASQFAAMVFLGSSIENDILEIKHLVLTMSSEMFPDMCDKSCCFQFLLSALENMKQQVTVTAWGMFKIEKNLFLVIFGAIVTYEVIIMQFMEKQ